MIRLLSQSSLLLVLTVLWARGEELRGQVVGVHDGDSITLLTTERTEVKVRLEGIDAPELGQAFGNSAKKALSNLVFQSPVCVRVTGIDSYRRTLGVVFADEHNINLEMVRLGMAWRYEQYSKDSSLLAAQQEAMRARKGLWATADPIPPWTWRKRKKLSNKR